MEKRNHYYGNYGARIQKIVYKNKTITNYKRDYDDRTKN